MAYTYADYDRLLKEKDVLIAYMRGMTEAREALTRYLDGSGNSDPNGDNAVCYLQKAGQRIASGEAWTGSAAVSCQRAIETLRKDAQGLAEYIRSTCGAILADAQEQVEDLQRQIAAGASDMDGWGTAEMYARSLFDSDMRR